MAVYGIEWVRRKGGGVPEVVDLPEGTSETFKAGQIVVWDTSEEGLVAASEGTVAMQGIALKDATGTAGTEIPVLLVSGDDIFTATISNAGANSAAAHDNDNVGRLLSYLASTESGQTAKITIDEADGGNHWVRVEGLYTTDDEPAGTAGGRVYFTFTETALRGETQA